MSAPASRGKAAASNAEGSLLIVMLFVRCEVSSMGSEALVGMHPTVKRYHIIMRYVWQKVVA
jgi:hypothetical protein